LYMELISSISPESKQKEKTNNQHPFQTVTYQ
jgi:hypothetical protein